MQDPSHKLILLMTLIICVVELQAGQNPKTLEHRQQDDLELDQSLLQKLLQPDDASQGLDLKKNQAAVDANLARAQILEKKLTMHLKSETHSEAVEIKARAKALKTRAAKIVTMKTNLAAEKNRLAAKKKQLMLALASVKARSKMLDKRAAELSRKRTAVGHMRMKRIKLVRQMEQVARTDLKRAKHSLRHIRILKRKLRKEARRFKTKIAGSECKGAMVAALKTIKALKSIVQEHKSTKKAKQDTVLAGEHKMSTELHKKNHAAIKKKAVRKTATQNGAVKMMNLKIAQRVRAATRSATKSKQRMASTLNQALKIIAQQRTAQKKEKVTAMEQIRVAKQAARKEASDAERRAAKKETKTAAIFRRKLSAVKKAARLFRTRVEEKAANHVRKVKEAATKTMKRALETTRRMAATIAALRKNAQKPIAKQVKRGNQMAATKNAARQVRRSAVKTKIKKGSTIKQVIRQAKKALQKWRKR